MNPDLQKRANREALERLYHKAVRERLWFHTRYQDLWFSPKEMKARWEKGEFLWGVENFELKNPNERLVELQQQITSLEVAMMRFKDRIRESNWGV